MGVFSFSGYFESGSGFKPNYLDSVGRGFAKLLRIFMKIEIESVKNSFYEFFSKEFIVCNIYFKRLY